MGNLIEDIGVSADWISRALQSSGYKANFSALSLHEIDRFFDEHADSGTPKPGGLLADDLGRRVFALGAYIGEVARRTQGGEWLGDETDLYGEINVELLLAGGSRCWPMQRVMKRLKNGAEDSVAAWGLGLGIPVGSRPVRRGLFRRLFGR